MGELWGSLSVSDHVKRRALVAEVLLFDRIVVPVPPEGDLEEENRWSANQWDPERQRRLLDILGDGGGREDLAVPVPWTRSKRDRFKELWKGLQAEPGKVGAERSELLSALRFDTTQLQPDAMMASRMMLTRDYDSGEEKYMRRLPRVYVEGVVPAYASFQAANKELALRVIEQRPTQAFAQVIGWELFLPEQSGWSDEQALEAAAALARNDDYRLERETFRVWWRTKIGTGTPAAEAVTEMVKYADKINEIARRKEKRTRVLRSFAALGGMTAIAGAWFPPAAVAGGVIALASVGADWVLKDLEMSPVLAPFAMFADARKHLGWR